MVQTAGLTPLMKQYVAIKQEYHDAIILFQVGDFYEIFLDDAKAVSQFLGIALTKRGEMNGQPIPLCGFPVHAVNHYIPKLVKGGFKLAICDQLEPAVSGKMVARGVTNVLTPATLVADNLLDAKSNSFLFSFFPTKTGYGLLFSELLTSQLHATVIPFGAFKQLETELFRFLPDEVVLLANKSFANYQTFFKDRGFYTTSYQTLFDQATIDQETAWLKQHLDSQSFAGLHHHSGLLYATILWKKYIEKNQQKALINIQPIQFYQPESFLLIDAATQKNLDLVKNSFDDSRSASLFGLVDKAVTPMGSRMIKRWLLSPLIDQDIIEQRQQAVLQFVNNQILSDHVEKLLQQCGDMQRIVGRIALDKATLSDFCNLANILSVLPALQYHATNTDSSYLHSIAASFKDFAWLESLLKRSCNDDASVEGIIKKGFDVALDRMKDLVENASQKILEMEQQEIARTGILSLKIRHNHIAGYYIEITKTNLDAVPTDFIECATLANRKRFTTKDLQLLQFEIVQAQKEFSFKEKEIFENIKEQVKGFVHDLRLASFALSQLDGLFGFAKVSYQQGWVCPKFHETNEISIEQGKHPIIASLLQEKFIPNDTEISDQQRLWIVTGPNMGGKSTYLRQVALICLLAQTGCFVPAKSAQLLILDRIFTRIGAGDSLAQGKSTFLVEMEETAQILQHATERSLVILDEVGRGTSTYDGLALAQAIIEYIFINIKASCLFATHYHELTRLADEYPGIVSFYADSVRTDTGIVFLHKLVAGKADESFGLEVAKLALIPDAVIQRAGQVLENLYKDRSNLHLELTSKPLPSLTVQPAQSATQSKFNAIVGKIESIDFDQLTAKQAYDLVWECKELMQKS